MFVCTFVILLILHKEVIPLYFSPVYYPLTSPYLYYSPLLWTFSYLLIFFVAVPLFLPYIFPSMLYPFPLLSKLPNIPSIQPIFVFSHCLFFSVTSYYSAHSSPALVPSSFPFSIPLFLDFYDSLYLLPFTLMSSLYKQSP